MEGDGPAKKLAKTTDDVPNEPSLETSSPVVKSSSFDQAVVKRKIPKSKASQTPAESPEPLPTEMIDLNEQCLLEVMQRLKLSGLCSMAEECDHFREVAQKFFSIKHREVSLTSLADTPDGKYSVSKVRQLLHNFGHLIESLTIDYTKLDDENDFDKVIELIENHCFDSVTDIKFTNQPCLKENIHAATSFVGMLFMLQHAEMENYDKVAEWSFGHLRSTVDNILVLKPSDNLN